MFGELIQKYLLTNNNYLRVIGRKNPNLTEDLTARNHEQLQLIKKALTSEEKTKLLGFKPSTEVQDPSSLPLIQPADFEFLEESMKKEVEIAGVKTTFVSTGSLPSITIRFDITDLEEEYINALEVYCKALPQMGYRGIDQPTYQAFLDRFVHNVELSFSTQKHPSGLKLFLFLKVEFLDRNTEFAFNILNGLINRPHFANLTKLS